MKVHTVYISGSLERHWMDEKKHGVIKMKNIRVEKKRKITS